MEAPEFLATSEAALYLGLVPETIRKLSNEGKIPVMRLGNGQRLYRRVDLEEYAAERAKRPQRRGACAVLPALEAST